MGSAAGSGCGVVAGEGGDAAWASAEPEVKLNASSNDQDPGARMVATITRDPRTRNWSHPPKSWTDRDDETRASRPATRPPSLLENPQFAGIYGRFTFVAQPSHKR